MAKESRAVRKPHVLAAEDDPVSRQYLKSVLDHYKFETDVATNGREAVEMWENGRYDAIVMDVQMPQVDGLAATREIREKERTRGGHIPIVAMTGHTSAEDEKACLEAGMDICLSKPVDLKAAARLLHDLMEERDGEAG
ncbi:response regulator [Geomonas sp. RF6]|uniref:response regulator n=1 Tax=Geomonas sp. RF6 TaxID=2897342 RepID=UPI001E406A58|nr:response regulator [Geomonas sp. RF6]UFS69759.1 response regulator [Geomonas sp. RF6]